MTQRKPVQRQTTSPSNAASALQLQVTSVPVGLSDREHPAPGVTPMDSSLIPTAGDNRRLVMGYESIGRLQLNPRDPRTYSPTEQRRVGKALKRFGAIPLIVTAERIMLSGNIWLEAAKLAGFTEVPVIVADHLSPSEADAFMLAQVRLIERGDESDKRGHGGRRSTLRPIFIKYPSMHAVMGAADMQHSGPTIEQVSVRSLKPYPHNARRHSKDQIKQIAASITRFGFNNPILIADDGEIVAGHGRLAAAKLLGLETVPTLRLSHLTEAERRAYVIADNKLALNAGWDREMLAIELQGLVDLDFEIELTGFSLAEVDIVLDEARESAPNGVDASVEDTIPPYRQDAPAVSQMGDLWLLGCHKLICGDARDGDAYTLLMGDDTADLICTDPPYNVPIDGHVCGSGRIRHRDFAMGVGEMNKDEFTRFLVDTLGLAAARCRDGAIAFVFMDWRHIGDLLSAGEQVFSELKNLCVWNKTNGGMGTFYRSKHELVFVFKVGTAPHVNTFGLGDTGRYRTNVWDYAGVNTFRTGRLEELELHPTVKPVDLVSDAIKDCSRRAGIVLDPFGGSGTTLIAAQKSGRSARLIEYDPSYCDVILQRFEAVTGTSAILAWTGQTFEDRAAERASAAISDDPSSRASTTATRKEPQ